MKSSKSKVSSTLQKKTGKEYKTSPGRNVAMNSLSAPAGMEMAKLNEMTVSNNNQYVEEPTEIMEQVGLERFDTDTESTSTAPDVMMIVPQTKNYMIISSSSEVRNPTQNHMEQYNLATFHNSVGISSMMALQTGRGYLWDTLTSPSTLPWVVVILLLFILFFPWTTVILVAIAVFLFMGTRSGSKPTKRIIKWTIQDFTEEIRGGFLTCPPFSDKTGQWRLVVCQKHCIDGIQTTMGLIATDLRADVEFVTATIRFSCTNQLGHELSPGMKGLKFVHKFECTGDCGYTRPIMFSIHQLGQADTLNVLCRVEFKCVNVGLVKLFASRLAERGDSSVVGGQKKGKTNNVSDFGTVRAEKLVYQNALSVQMQPLTRFVQHVETKTFVWDIPNFEMLMQNMEVWGIFSPQFFVNSHDFCSIWRMKLIELHGVFRLHVQLRGLPRSVKQIRLRYLLQLVDNFGDSVIPEHSICRVKYPDHLNLWDTTRHILYRRETIVDRFVASDGTLTLRLSLHLEPNDLAILERDSDEWICPN